MSIKYKKIFKRVFIFLVSILLLLLLALGIVINYVFTPEKLTPKATKLVNEYIDGRLDLERVELTFFSSFPELKAELTNGLLISAENDSLLSFNTINVLLNPISIFSDEKIHIDKLLIDNPSIYARMDSLGNSNWNIVKAQPEDDSVTISSSEDPSNDTYIIDDIEINHGAIKFQDFTNYFSLNIQSMDVIGKVSYLNELIDCDLDLALQNMAMTLNEELIINPVSINFHSRSNINLENSRINIDTINLKVVDHELEIETKGSIQLDSLGGLAIDLKNRLFTSNIREALDLIPIRYMNLTGFQGKGEVDLSANIYGNYSENNFPVVDMNLKIVDGQASYRDFPNEIELFETTIAAKIDFLNRSSSRINVPNLKVISDGLSIDLNGKVEKILTDPHVILQGNGGVDFEELLLTIPVEGLIAKGNANFDINTDLYIEDIINYDYGKVVASGMISLKDIDFNYSDSIKLKSKNSKITLGQAQGANKFGLSDSRLLTGKIVLRDFAFEIDELINASGNGLRVNLNTTPIEDTTMISPIRAGLTLSNSDIMLGDTLSIKANSLKGSVLLKSNNSRAPVVNTSLRGDRFLVDAGSDYLNLKKFEYQFRIIKKEERWPMSGHFKFDNLKMFTSSFPKAIVISKTKIGVKTNELSLDRASVKIGKSDFKLSGKISNLQKLLFQNTMKAELKVNSDYLNVNQLVSILNKGADLQNADQTILADTTSIALDTTALETFVVPKNIDFKLKLNLKKVRYGDLNMRNVKGNLLIKNQVVQLKDLHMKTKAADLWTNARYVARNKDNAKANFNLKLTDIDVANMFEVLPFMDTLLPMTKDFEGNLNIGMQGSAKIGKHMEVEQSSIAAVGRIEGQNLVLLDGETFQYLAKTLKFKNREKNTLDTLTLEMAIENGSLEIFPSLITMDRYRVAVGGIQNLDLTYNYHISVLDSPLPFKTGIDIFGKAEEYDYKITKAKYKYIFSDKAKHKDKADPELMKKKNEILERIKFD